MRSSGDPFGHDSPPHDDSERALDDLVPEVYGELRRRARRELARWRPGSTLGTTSLVHEWYVKLARRRPIPPSERPRFLALAAASMRQIIVDWARRRHRLKRGREWTRVEFPPAGIPAEDPFPRLIELDEALERLGRFDTHLRDVVDCRVFGGMTVDESAAALGVAPRTVDRAWARAKVWLYEELHGSD